MNGEDGGMKDEEEQGRGEAQTKPEPERSESMINALPSPVPLPPSPFPLHNPVADATDSPSAVRLLLDPPAPGAWNMAVDEVLWRWSAATGRCCWRFYRWKEPTLSLGYFQSYEERLRHAPSLSCPVVRRPSGGGAIVHDKELTYSLAIPASHPLAVRRSPLYRAVHTALVEALAELGVAAALCVLPEAASRAEQPFLCFQRRTSGDVLLGQAKIAGSAQRRDRGAVLQHGSILLAQSQAAPELPGIDRLSGRPVQEEQLVRIWLERLSLRLGLTWQLAPLDEEERCQAHQVAQQKFASEDWTRDRGRPGRSPGA